MKDKFRSPGFSLIEILVALAILAVGILVVAAMQESAIRSLSYSRHLAAATELAQAQLEFLRSLPYDDSRPTMAPSLESGGSVKDIDNNSVFLDPTLGDGVPSPWHGHPDNPLNDRGLPEGSTETRRYFVRWTVERGGAGGTPDPAAPAGAPAGTNTIGIPGPGQMRIVVEVIWWERNEDRKWSVQMSDEQVRASRGHLVRLQDLRQSNI